MVTTPHKPVLIVIAGPNGSGKTTITTQILQHEWMEDAVYVNPDQIAKDKFGDWNSPEAIMQSVKYCETLREDCLRERKSLIFETVLSADDKLDYIRRAHDAGFFIRFFYVCTSDPAINVMRITQRYLDGGHEVPISKIISRYYKSLLNAAKAISFVDRAYIYDNSVDNQLPRLLFRTSDGKLFKQYTDDIPEWAKTLLG
jgi:predicted ABC-type ATPase